MLSHEYLDKGASIGIVVGIITFVVSWICCIAAFGFLLGVGLGWLPSLIVAVIAHTLTMLLWGPISLILALVVAGITIIFFREEAWGLLLIMGIFGILLSPVYIVDAWDTKRIRDKWHNRD